MDYPQEILPNPDYKLIDCDLNDHFLIRFTNTNNINEIWDSETNTVSYQQICSPGERIDDLSMSLLDVYKVAHIFLDFTPAGREKYMFYCSPDDAVGTPVYATDFFTNNNRHYWCVPINQLHNREFKYEQDNLPLTATCIVTHKPMRWNFWHFSLRWKLDLELLEDMPDKTRKKIAKKIGQAVRVTIAHFAIIHEPEHPIYLRIVIVKIETATIEIRI